MGTERVDTNTPFAAESVHVLGIDDLEAQPELLAHLALPLPTQARRADDQDLLCLVAEHKLLSDQAGFDRLAEPNVVGDQQRTPVACAAPRRAAAAGSPRCRCRSGTVTGRPRGPPTRSRPSGRHRGRRRTCPPRRVPPPDQAAPPVADLSPGFGLPEHCQRLRAALVVDRDQVDPMVLDRACRAQAGRAGAWTA